MCVFGRGVGMSTPPHVTPKRIMHIELIDSVGWVQGYSWGTEHLLQSASIVILRCACMISIH